jgi:hypothetical protein
MILSDILYSHQLTIKIIFLNEILILFFSVIYSFYFLIRGEKFGHQNIGKNYFRLCKNSVKIILLSSKFLYSFKEK